MEVEDGAIVEVEVKIKIEGEGHNLYLHPYCMGSS